MRRLAAIPWLLAIVGIAIPLVGSGFAVWPLSLVWLLLLGVAGTLGRAMLADRRGLRIALAVALLPALLVLAFEGGWWLIPADVAWLTTELALHPPR